MLVGTKNVVKISASSDLSAGDSAHVLVPGRKRLMQEVRDSDSDSEE